MNAETRRGTFDPAALLERLDGNRSLAGELIDTFLEEAPAILGSLRGAVDARDGRGIERSAHGARGALLNLSASEAAQLAHQLESAARRGEFVRCADLLPELESAFTRVERQMRSFKTQLS